MHVEMACDEGTGLALSQASPRRSICQGGAACYRQSLERSHTRVAIVPFAGVNRLELAADWILVNSRDRAWRLPKTFCIGHMRSFWAVYALQ